MHLLGAGVVVDYRWVTVVYEQVALAAHAFCYAAAYLANLLMAVKAPLGVECADNAFHLHLVGDDVGAAFSDELAEAEYRGHHGGSVAAHYLLQSHHNVRGYQDGVDTHVGCGTVAAFALDGPVQFVGRCHVASLFHADMAVVHLRQAVERVYLVGRYFVKQAVVHHHAGTAGIHLLRRLEDKHDAPVQLFAQGAQYLGGTQQRAGVHIVAAGVHDSGVLRSKVKPCGLCEGQRVVVGAQADTIAVGVFPAAYHGHHTRLANACLGLQSHLAQPLGDKSHGAELLLAQLRVAVHPPPPAYHLFTVLAGKCLDGIYGVIHFCHAFALRMSIAVF